MGSTGKMPSLALAVLVLIDKIAAIILTIAGPEAGDPVAIAAIKVI